ncbi:helix-turn-helix transcriptional regulator [Sediminitomix flava]|uniref:Helix-turn-helix protein n=1 Tax=Sediminitomix flava TaxID=379075 RepID=A0A316A3M6_SEDFL|nr:AraC family transcriptional regulator [Sediminitomix flava]PWJ44327.1 helix-turn-helix protein [Sediminitomix flava]
MEIFEFEQIFMSESLDIISRDLGIEIWDKERLEHSSPTHDYKINLYKQIEGVEIGTFDLRVEDEHLLVGRPSRDSYYSFRFMFDGVMYQEKVGEKKVALGDDSLYSASFYDTRNDMRFYIPPHSRLRFVNIVITHSFFENVIERYYPGLTELVNECDDWLLFDPLNVNIRESLREIFEEEADAIFHSGNVHMRGMEMMNTFINVLKRNSQEKGIISTQIDPDNILNQIKDELSQNLANPPSMKELTERFSMSSEKLRTSFKRTFGLPPHQYLLNLRFSKAYEMVTQTDEPMSNIAYTLGFTHPSHFNRGFRKQFGLSPSILRENYKKEQLEAKGKTLPFFNSGLMFG